MDTYICPECGEEVPYLSQSLQHCRPGSRRKPAPTDAESVRCSALVSLAARWRDFAAQHRKYAKEYEDAREPEFLVSAHTSKAQVFEQCAATLAEWAGSEANDPS